jgi:hypothetical protein
VGHIVDEVIAHLRELLLTEYNHYGEDKRDEKNAREHQGWYHEPDAGEDVRVDIGKVYRHNTSL